MRQRSHQRDIEQNFPHQVAIWHLFCTMENFEPINQFCTERFGEHPQSYRVYMKWEGFDLLHEDMRIFCFREAAQAAEFAAYFEGEPFDPKACQKGQTMEKVWVRRGNPTSRIKHGPLSVPKWIRGRH
jgi:hypothetical protein